MPDRMSHREWTGTLLAAGLVVVIAASIESHPGDRTPILLASLVGAIAIPLALTGLRRYFSRKVTPRSVRLQMEVHP